MDTGTWTVVSSSEGTASLDLGLDTVTAGLTVKGAEAMTAMRGALPEVELLEDAQLRETPRASDFSPSAPLYYQSSCLTWIQRESNPSAVPASTCHDHHPRATPNPIGTTMTESIT